MDARRLGAMAKLYLALRAADFRPCRGAVRARGRPLAVFSGLGLVRACGQCTRAEFGREPLEP
eukprot:4434698-Alexandrium_andersonii.AAC.1